MAIVFGVLLLVGGFAVLIWRPWLAPDQPRLPARPASVPASRSPRPRPRPTAGVRPSQPHHVLAHTAQQEHRLERIPRSRRVPPEPGRDEILLPEWLGPVS